MPQVTITPGIEHSGIMIRDTSNIEENKSQSKVVAGTVNSKEQSQSHVCQWRNQQLMRGERPRAAIAPICGTLPGTLVDPIRGPPPASVGDESRPNCRQYDHLVVPHGIYCTLVALESLSFSTVFLISFVQAKRGDYYTSTSWAPYIWHFAILILTGCAAMHLIVAIIGVSHNGNNLVLPMLWKDQMCGRCDREVCCTLQIGALKVVVPVLCLVNFFLQGLLYLTFQGGDLEFLMWFGGMAVWLALSITGFACLCCIARKDS